ncbi:MAG: glucose-1-phosphate adenylyltransferase [Gemmataceae bacterium]
MDEGGSAGASDRAGRRVVSEVLTLVLAGGRGSRLGPLTRDRAKPAVPFGGQYRIIDFTLSNCINSGLRQVLVLTQYKARSLNRHIATGWEFLSRQLDEYIEVLPPQQRINDSWYRGTADAIYQNIYTIEKASPRHFLILAGDHIYKMDYRGMLRYHVDRRADVTIGCIPVPLAEGPRFGVMDVDPDGRVRAFAEKPEVPPPLPGDPASCLASMGIYVFSAPTLYEMLFQDADRVESEHNFGTDIIPPMLAGHRVQAYRFEDRNKPVTTYWRDVGTIDSYYQANMDLVAVDPVLNLYDRTWPIRTAVSQAPPPKFVHSGHDRRGEALMSMVCQGCIVSGAHIRDSILSPNVRVNSFAEVEGSLLFEGVDVGRHCRIRRAIVDKDVKLPQNATIGYDHDLDRRRGFTVTDSGVVVVPKSEPVETFTTIR